MPDKDGIPIANATPRNAVEHGRGGVYESSTIPQGIDEGVKGHSPFEMEE